ncbi:hypothetical protein DSO57_1025244 [Entomophthora muscae]|uniref:Uncharacterized protein n=1 Tax=Entomophthora muscae TaxID=34485 RepID=A0ACC2T2I1_9FUNG|nr:hypothetical protein DSO57_1025244 [Entomophthora muscae]
MKSSIIFALFVSVGTGQVYEDSQRPQVCERNEATCQTQCDRRKVSAKINSCDPDTFNFVCICSDNYTPNPANVTFPAALASCQISGVECAKKCTAEDVTCAQRCVTQYVCNGSGDSTDTAEALPTTTSSDPKATQPSIYDANTGSTASTAFIPFAVASLLFTLS